MQVSMRRKRQELSGEEREKILMEGSHGVLALCGEDTEPYAVPMSFAFCEGKVIFHCAKEGKKLKIIRQNPLASFCVVGMDSVVPEKFTTRFKSVIVTGRLDIVEDEGQKLKYIKAIAAKYSPGESRESTEKEISLGWKGLCILRLTPCRITGKQAKEIVGSEG